MTQPDVRTEALWRLIEPSVVAMGYGLVRVLVSGSSRPMLQIMAERSDGEAMTVEDCAEISRNISALLDVEDPIRSAYVLEVSSPGIDRPLVKLADYARFAGQEARLETRDLHDGRRRFTGRLLGVAGAAVRLETEAGEIAIAFDDIRKAKLIVPDHLFGTKEPSSASQQR